MYDKDFALSEEEKIELKSKLEAFSFHENLTDHIEKSRHDFESLIEDSEYFEDKPERLSEICDNLFEPIYEKTSSPTYDAFQEQMARHGIDLPERDPDHSVAPENNAGNDSSDETLGQSKNEYSKQNPSGSEKYDEGEIEPRPQLGMTPEQKHQLEQSLKQQKGQVDAGLKDPSQLMGQVAARFFRHLKTVWNNIAHLEGFKETKLGPIKIPNNDPRSTISTNDSVNALKKDINSLRDGIQVGGISNPESISMGMDNLNLEINNLLSNKEENKVTEKDHKILSDSVKSLDQKIKDKGFGKDSEDVDKKMDELKKAMKDLFESIFKKKGPSKDGPAPS